jgi:hypothetical protein
MTHIMSCVSLGMCERIRNHMSLSVTDIQIWNELDATGQLDAELFDPEALSTRRDSNALAAAVLSYRDGSSALRVTSRSILKMSATPVSARRIGGPGPTV